MTQTTYDEMPRLISMRQPFEGNSVTAKQSGGEYYVVYSYDTPIAKFRGGDLVYFDNTQYSSTTSRIQNIIKDVTIPSLPDDLPRRRYETKDEVRLAQGGQY